MALLTSTFAEYGHDVNPHEVYQLVMHSQKVTDFGPAADFLENDVDKAVNM